MKRILTFMAAFLILTGTASFATAQSATQKTPIYSKVVKKIPLVDWAKWAADQADEATRKDSPKIARVVDRGFSEKAELVTGTESVDVVVEQTTSYWRGSVTQRVTMPCTATLAMDANKLLAYSWFNPATNTIEVCLPPLSVISVENHSSRSTTAPEYSGGCWEWYDSGTATSLENSLLKADWAGLARGKIDPNAHHLREVAKNETTRFLKGMLEPIVQDLKIVVNP